MFTIWLKQQQLWTWGTSIFAAFFVGESQVEAHYYSIKQLHKAIPDPARLLGVFQDNFQALLVASGLGSLCKNGQFIFQKNKFYSVLTMNKVQDMCELVYCQLKGFCSQHYFVKVGTKLGNEANAPGARGISAQICNIRVYTCHGQSQYSAINCISRIC
jgi:hypothetical protein